MLIIGIGQSSLDYLAVVDSYPPADTKKEVLEWYEQGGGPVATALVTLSRLGNTCKFYGVVGDDHAGERIVQSLKNENVDTGSVVVREKAASQLAFIAIEKETAKRTIFWKRPSGKALMGEELPDHFLNGADFLLLDGLMQDVSFYAASRAKEQGIPVMLDAGRLRPGMIEVAGLSDYVVASGEFAKDLHWDLSERVLRSEKEKLGAHVLTVTLGERGCVTVSDSLFLQTPAFKVSAVDTTGAGDVFHGGYVYGLLKGWSLRDTVIFASAAAAMKCRKIGGRDGIPNLGEVRAFLSDRGHELPPDDSTQAEQPPSGKG